MADGCFHKRPGPTCFVNWLGDDCKRLANAWAENDTVAVTHLQCAFCGDISFGGALASTSTALIWLSIAAASPFHPCVEQTQKFFVAN